MITTAENIPPDGQHNIGHICTKMQCGLGFSQKIAMRWIPADLGSGVDYTFADLEERTNKVANVLASLGFARGDVLFTLLPKAPEQFFFLLGALKLQLVVSPLFSSFGEEAILDRAGSAHAKVLVTKKSLLRKLEGVRGRMPDLKHVILTDGEAPLHSGTVGYNGLVRNASGFFDTPVTPPDTPSLLHYTSGSTGKPKGVLHAHKAAAFISRTTREVLGLREDDIFWCTADQGWVTGTSYGIIGPWSRGITQVHFGGHYSPQAWMELLEREKVTVWYTAPTALRMLMKEDAAFFGRFDLKSLRHICSVGEPLNPEIIHWSRRVLGKEIYDTWFQTETGAIMIANRPGLAVKPGSMGKPVEGVRPEVTLDKGGVAPAGQCGNLCLKAGWGSMFVTYLGNEAAYREKFRAGYYRSGDIVFKDDEGYYWFSGREDDVINTAGCLVGPFEVESALLELDEITEAAVVAVPDRMLFEKVVAFIKLKPGLAYDRSLELKLRIHIADKVSTIAVPQDIVVVDSIPKTRSGKIMRRVMKTRYLGQDAGDLSAMED